MELKLFRVIKNVMLLKIVHSEVQPYQQSVSSPCQGVLLYTFQEGHGILEQKIRVVSQLCAQAFRFTHESLKPHPFMYNLGSQLSNFIRAYIDG